MTATSSPTQTRPGREAGRRAGYLATALVNAAVLVTVNAFWDLLPFLTDEFPRVLPLVNLSLAATAVVNVVYALTDPKAMRSLGEVVLLGLSMAATLRIYRVFPFDLSAYADVWTTAARVVLVLAMVGIGIALVVETSKLVGRAVIDGRRQV